MFSCMGAGNWQNSLFECDLQTADTNEQGTAKLSQLFWQFKVQISNQVPVNIFFWSANKKYLTPSSAFRFFFFTSVGGSSSSLLV